MTTFSQLVDKVVLETSRPDLRDQIADYLNQTIREIHFNPDNGEVVFYESNYREAQIVATAESAQAWQLPDIATFQKELCVRFDDVWSGDGPTFAEKAIPGPKMHQLDYFYYRGADTLVFGGQRGYGGIGARVSVAWFEYPRGLRYYALAQRPASYALDTGWTYAAEFNTNDATRLIARDRVTNWVLQRWEPALLEGLRAKIYKRVGDESRQRTSYSLFMQLRKGLMSSEASDYGVYHK
jgi:hypothetical protein